MEARESIFNTLYDNITLREMLDSNIAHWQRIKSDSRKNSIIHVSRLNKDMKGDFITLDFGDSTRNAERQNVEYYGELLYIRAYIAKGSGYIKATQMLREVYASLHDADIQADAETVVRLEHLNTGADLYDAGVGKEYKQATYRIYKLI